MTILSERAVPSVFRNLVYCKSVLITGKDSAGPWVSLLLPTPRIGEALSQRISKLGAGTVGSPGFILCQCRTGRTVSASKLVAFDMDKPPEGLGDSAGRNRIFSAGCTGHEPLDSDSPAERIHN
jgi:hypothetical protein